MQFSVQSQYFFSLKWSKPRYFFDILASSHCNGLVWNRTKKNSTLWTFDQWGFAATFTQTEENYHCIKRRGKALWSHRTIFQGKNRLTPYGITLIYLDLVSYLKRFAKFGTLFVQFKEREKHLWSSVTFSKVIPR